MRNWCCTGISRRLCALALVLVALQVAGCTHLFFFPSRQQVLTPAQFGLASKDVALVAADGTRLFAWHLPRESPRGVVCFFHGNAENISTHIVNAAWLPPAGYEVLLVDYRGYGASAGEPAFPEVLADVRAGLDWCLARGRAIGVPVFAFGQSLGAAMMLDVVAMPPYRDELAGVIADSGFSSYRRVARDAMAHSWLLWPLQYPLSWLVTGGHSPEAAARAMGGIPLLVMHSGDDSIVPYAHGERIFTAKTGARCFLRTHGPHNAALGPKFPGGDAWRAAVQGFLDEAGGAQSSGGSVACRAPLLDRLPDQ